MDDRHTRPADLDGRLPPHEVYGEATFSGGLALVAVDHHRLSAALPSSLILAPRAAANHHCLVAFGAHADSTSFFGGVRLPWHIRFRELMVAVPHVRWTAGEDAHLFIQGMACDIWPAVWNGNVSFGFRKQYATVQWNGQEFHASANGSADCHATLRCLPGDDDARTVTGPELLQAVRAAATLPVLGRRDDGTFIYSRFEWNFDCAAVDVADIGFHGGSMFPWLSGDARHQPSDAIGLRVQGMRWRLSWPQTHGTRSRHHRG